MSQPEIRARAELLRVLGLAFGLAVVVGAVVGQGIMRTPGIVAGAIPDKTLILAFWLAGGALVAVSAFALVELATSIPRAGGPYTFAGRAFGPFAGTLVGWVDWLNGIVAIGYFSVVFAEYLQRLGLLTGVPIGVLAVALIVAVTSINWMGTRACGMSQTIGSSLKGLGLLLLVGLLFLAPGAAGAGLTSNSSPTLTLAAFAIALRAIQVTYAGWHTAAYFSEELHAPERNVVRSVFGGIALVTALYVLVNAAILHVLSPEQMAASKLPAADALGVALGPRADVMVNTLALISVAAIANLFPMYLSRIGFAMARNGVLPAFLARVSASGSPRVALVVTTALAALLAASGSYEQLIAIGVPLSISVDISVNAAAIAMRLREPALTRPFRMPLFPLPAIVGLILNGLLLATVVYENPSHSLLGLTTVAIIGLVYQARSVLLRRRTRGAA